MSNEHRQRFDLFRSDSCKFPYKSVAEIMGRAVSNAVVQAPSGRCAGWLLRDFVLDLVETAQRLAGKAQGPLTPDMIMLAYNELENRGKIPGKSTGMKKGIFL
jgi:hypothetical protein